MWYLLVSGTVLILLMFILIFSATYAAGAIIIPILPQEIWKHEREK